jgi:hypothetical protein
VPPAGAVSPDCRWSWCGRPRYNCPNVPPLAGCGTSAHRHSFRAMLTMLPSPASHKSVKKPSFVSAAE